MDEVRIVYQSEGYLKPVVELLCEVHCLDVRCSGLLSSWSGGEVAVQLAIYGLGSFLVGMNWCLPELTQSMAMQGLCGWPAACNIMCPVNVCVE